MYIKKKKSYATSATHIPLCQVFIFIAAHNLAVVMCVPWMSLKVTHWDYIGILLTISMLSALLKPLVTTLGDIFPALVFLPGFGRLLSSSI
jgi:hypothetical protein